MTDPGGPFSHFTGDPHGQDVGNIIEQWETRPAAMADPAASIQRLERRIRILRRLLWTSVTLLCAAGLYSFVMGPFKFGFMYGLLAGVSVLFEKMYERVINGVIKILEEEKVKLGLS